MKFSLLQHPLSHFSRLAFAIALTTASAQAESMFYPSLENGESMKVIAMGTSLSEGGAYHNKSTEDRWTGQFQIHLDTLYPGQAVIDNQAVSASNSGLAPTNFTHRNGLAMIDPMLGNYAPGSLDLVVLEYTTNDAYAGFTSDGNAYPISVSQSVANLNDLISKVRAHSADAELLLLTGTFAQPGTAADTSRPDLELYNDAWRGVANKDPEIHFGDVYAEFEELYLNDPTNYDGDYVPDGIHPTLAGHQVFRDTVIEALSPASAPEPSGALLLSLALTIGLFHRRR